MFKEAPYYGKLDEVLLQLGDMGAFNIKNYTIILTVVFFAGMHGQVYVFEALDIDYRCKVEECEGTGNPSKWMKFAIPPSKNHPGYARCERYTAKHVLVAQPLCKASLFTKKTERCSEYVYAEKTAVRDFNLGCRDGTKTMLAACHNAGLFASLPLAGYVADRYGRPLAVSLASFMTFALGMLKSWSVNFYMLLVLEIVEATFGAGAYTTVFVLGMEIVGPDSRLLAGTIINTFFITGTVSVGALAWIIRDWRILHRVVYTPAILCTLTVCFLDESVRWLLSKGRNREAIAKLEKAAKMNKVTLLKIQRPKSDSDSENSCDQFSNTSQISDEEKSEKPQKSSIRQVYESADLKKTLASCSILWFTCTFIYYGLSLNAVYISGNKYVNFMMVAFVEIPAYFAYLALAQKYNQKVVIIYAFLIGAICCLVLPMIPNAFQWVFLTVYLFAKFFVTITYTGVYIFVSNLVPAHLRQFLLTICSLLGRFGAILAPFTPLLAVYYYNLPAMLFGTLAGAAVFNITVTLNNIYSEEKNLEPVPVPVPKNTKICSAFLFCFQAQANFYL